MAKTYSKYNLSWEEFFYGFGVSLGYIGAGLAQSTRELEREINKLSKKEFEAERARILLSSSRQQHIDVIQYVDIFIKGAVSHSLPQISGNPKTIHKVDNILTFSCLLSERDNKRNCVTIKMTLRPLGRNT